MAQDRNPVDASRETENIKHEIERTRVEMSETLGEIQDRLRPDHLLQQARDGVTQAAAGKMRTMMSTAREKASTMATRARGAGTYLTDYATDHPVRVAAAVGALTWWMLRVRNNRADDWYGAAETNWDEADVITYVDEEPSLRDRVSNYASSARDTVGEYASSARGAAAEYAGSARETARRARMRMRDAAGTATTNADEWLRSNPMAAGALALAAGVAIGLSAPRTSFEDGALGQTRDRALARGREMANNLRQNMSDKVATAAENLVGDSIKEPATTSPLPKSPDPMGRA